MPNSDIFDRKEGYGHTDGTEAAGKDNLAAGSTVAQWSGDALTVPAQASEATTPRLARTVDTKDATSRQYINPAGTVTGTNTGLTTASTEANTSRTADVVTAAERAAIGFADRTSGWGHSEATAPADLKDA